MLLSDVLLILFLRPSETTNALTALPSPPYSLASSSSHVVGSAKAVPVFCVTSKAPPALALALSRSGVAILWLALGHTTACPSGESESQTIRTSSNWAASTAFARRLSTDFGCFPGTMAPRIRVHFTFAGPSAIPIRPHYVSMPTTAITASSPFPPRPYHPCSSQRAIRFQDRHIKSCSSLYIL